MTKRSFPWVTLLLVSPLFVLVMVGFGVSAHSYMKYQQAKRSLENPDETFLLNEMGYRTLEDYKASFKPIVIKRNGYTETIERYHTPFPRGKKRPAQQAFDKYEQRWNITKPFPIFSILLLIGLVALVRARMKQLARSARQTNTSPESQQQDLGALSSNADTASGS